MYSNSRKPRGVVEHDDGEDCFPRSLWPFLCLSSITSSWSDAHTLFHMSSTHDWLQCGCQLVRDAKNALQILRYTTPRLVDFEVYHAKHPIRRVPTRACPRTKRQLSNKNSIKNRTCPPLSLLSPFLFSSPRSTLAVPPAVFTVTPSRSFLFPCSAPISSLLLSSFTGRLANHPLTLR